MPRSIGTNCGVKITSTGLPAAAGEELVDLRRVAVAADVIGRNALVALGVVRRELERPACAADAALGIDDDVAVSINPAFNKGARARIAVVG